MYSEFSKNVYLLKYMFTQIIYIHAFYRNAFLIFISKVYKVIKLKERVFFFKFIQTLMSESLDLY